jgi:hypothetical protein
MRERDGVGGVKGSYYSVVNWREKDKKGRLH